MKYKKAIKRVATFLVAIAIAGTIATQSNDNSVIKTSATPTYDDYQRQIAQYEQQEADLDSQINSYNDEIADKEKRQAAIEEKIATVQKKIDTAQKYSDSLVSQMADLDTKVRATRREIEKTDKKIKSGVEDFKKRLRTIYISGNDSYIQMFFESSDFYDILMKTELIQRVAQSDKDKIDNLVKLKEESEQKHESLQAKQKEIKSLAKTYTEQLAKLNEEKSGLDALLTENNTTLAEIQNNQNNLANKKNEISQNKENAKYNATTTTTTTTTTRYTTTIYNNNNNNNNNNNYNTTTTKPAVNPTGGISTVVNYALSNVGGTYVWGGANFRACDCSGLVMISYAQIGINLTHLAATQATYGREVSYSNLQAGDLVFFGSNFYHVAIYIGGGNIVHAANSNDGIIISNLADFSRWGNPISALRRII